MLTIGDFNSFCIGFFWDTLYISPLTLQLEEELNILQTCSREFFAELKKDILSCNYERE